jgi:hypothetical protein
MWRGLKRELSYRPFLVLLGLGLFVRIAVMAMYFPAWLQTPDSIRFARLSTPAIFSDYWMPAGYAMFARGLRAIVPELWVITGIQHLIGLAIGTVLFLAMRRLGAKPWLACIPAAVVFLSGDQLWIEHQIMAETLMTALLAAGLACAIRGLVPEVDLRWLAAGSAFLMGAALTRNVALVALPVLVLCTAFWARGSSIAVARALTAAVVPAAVVFGLYFGAYKVSDGEYLGMTDMGGWDLYTRVGPFADCTKFTPPAGTGGLCEDTPRNQRDGPYGYIWDPNAVSRELFEISPQTSPLLGEFAKQAIVHQPLSYLKEVALETSRYVDPGIDDDRPWSGVSGAIQGVGLFGTLNPETEDFVEREMGRGYQDAHARVTGRQLLATYQVLFHVGGLALLALVVFTLIGMFMAQGGVRVAIFLFGGTALLLYVMPVFTLAYEVRYGLPPLPFLVMSGTLGVATVLERRYPGALFYRYDVCGPTPDDHRNREASPLPMSTAG